MRNVLFITKNIAIVIMTILYIIFFNISGFSSVPNFIIMGVLLYLIVSDIFHYTKSNKYYCYNAEINFLKLSVYSVISLLLYRSSFDLNLYDNYSSFESTSNSSIFYNNNMTLVLLLVLALLSYDLIIKKSRSKKQKNNYNK